MRSDKDEEVLEQPRGHLEMRSDKDKEVLEQPRGHLEMSSDEEEEVPEQPRDTARLPSTCPHSTPPHPSTSIDSQPTITDSVPSVPSASYIQFPTMLPTLAPDKQNRTTLRIRLPLFSDHVPLKLRTGMTLDSLFSSVITIYGQEDQEASIMGIRASFGWKSTEDPDSVIILKRAFPDSYEIFLEIINDADVWEEQGGGGRCAVDIEPVLV